MELSSVDHASIASTLLTRGYAFAHPNLEVSLLERLDTEIRRLTRDEQPATPNLFSGLRTRRYFGLLSGSPVWEEVATQQDVLNVIQRVLGPGFLLSLISTALIEPGESEQELHADDDVYGLPRPHQPLVVNTIWALSDFEESNGATRAIPGSHESIMPPLDALNPDEIVPCIMPRGSILFILGSTFHGAGANRSDNRRNGLVVNYCARHLRQHENLLLGLTPEKVASFSRTLRALLGCIPEGPGLGVAAPWITKQLTLRR